MFTAQLLISFKCSFYFYHISRNDNHNSQISISSFSLFSLAFSPKELRELKYRKVFYGNQQVDGTFPYTNLACISNTGQLKNAAISSGTPSGFYLRKTTVQPVASLAEVKARDVAYCAEVTRIGGELPSRFPRSCCVQKILKL